jgi:hypothetical protein
VKRLALVLLAALAGRAHAGGDEAKVWLAAIRTMNGDDDCRVVYISRTEDMRSGDGAAALKRLREDRDHDPQTPFGASAATRADFARRAKTRGTVALADPKADAVKPDPAWDNARDQAYYDAHPDACEPVFGVSPVGFDGAHHEALVYVKVHKLVGHGYLVRLVKHDGEWVGQSGEITSYDAE